ncbi:MAG: portal protein [Hyphomicrobium sp.]
MADTQAPDIKAIKKRAQAAVQYRGRWDKLLREVYEYVIPYRSAGLAAGPGDNLTDKVFDATAIDAAFRFAGRLQQELTPPFQKFFELHAGPAVGKNADEKKELDERLALISEAVSAALSTSQFHLASAEMYLDLFAGTGAMLMLQGDKHQPIRCLSVPIQDLALELGPWGDIWGRYWTRTWKARQIKEMWPNGKFGEALSKKIKETPDADIGICQATLWDQEKRSWRLHVFELAADAAANSGEAHEIFTEEYRKSPWITPRCYVVPGEPYGRGPGMLALPFIKTLNKTQELELQAAALALFGIFTARDDSVFNPNTARFEPGAIWKVASNAGGSMGPSLQKLDVPGKFDLSRMVTEDQRAQINHVTFNRQLPPITGAVRSPTEIMERVRDLDIDLGGLYGRLSLENVQPAVERAIDILEGLGVLPTKIDIDQLQIGIRVTSPIANSQKAAKAKTTIDYFQIVQSFLGADGLASIARVETAFPKLGRQLGVDEEDLRTYAETQDFKRQIIERAARMVADEQIKSMPPAAEPEPPTADEVALQ